jgi:ribosomal-protein-alanine N-acetyltransferase
MNDITEIQTARMILKPVTPAIVSNLFETQSPDEIKSFFQIEKEEFENLKLMNDHGMESFRISLYYFLLIDKTSNEIIGECGFHTWNVFHGRADIFYKLKSDDIKQKGYMKEALFKVLEYGFENLDLHRIQALVADNNIPSLKLLERFGFQKEGRLREDYLVNGIYEDSECYSLLKREWEAKGTVL